MVSYKEFFSADKPPASKDLLGKFGVLSHLDRAVGWYLMAAYAYYELDEPLISDLEFDQLAKLLLDNWDNLTHPHKKFLTEEMLQAGTFIGKYPSIVEGATLALLTARTKEAL